MEDFGIPPVGWGDRYSGKSAIDPRKRQRQQQDQEQQEQQDPNEEPVDTVVLSSNFDEESERPEE